MGSRTLDHEPYNYSCAVASLEYRNLTVLQILTIGSAKLVSVYVKSCAGALESWFLCRSSLDSNNILEIHELQRH